MKKGPINFTAHAGNKGKNPLMDAMATVVRDMEIHMEYKQIKAKLDRAYYNELIAEKFTPEQALELVKSTNYGS